MATRNDITVFQEVSPRFAEIAAPSTEIVMQDYVDTLRGLEDDFLNMSFPFLIQASGKEDLGGGVLVAITVEEQNLQLAFQPRFAPAVTGTVTTASGPPNINNRITFVDSAADFVTAGVQPGSYLINWTDRSVTDVVRVVNSTTLETRVLNNGTDNEWDLADDYSLWNITQVRTSGGNLVAVDDLDAAISAILPTWGTQVVVAQSSSGTLVGGTTLSTQVSDIHGQVRRSIFINTEALTNGNGYQQTPYNNWTDGVDAAEASGLQTLYLEADATVDRQLKNFEIFGIDLPTIVLNGQNMDGTVLRLCNIQGTQGGTGQLVAFDCQMTNVTDFNGAASLVGAIGTIAFRNGGSSILNQLVTFTPNQVTLSLTTGGAACSVEINNASGDFLITNMDDASDVLHLRMDHGRVTLDASCTAGTIVLSGHAHLTDNSAGSTVDIDALTNRQIIEDDVWDALIANHSVTGSFGEFIARRLLTVAKYFSLRT